MAPNLSYEIIDTKPRYFDFSQGVGETWHIPLPLTADEERNERYVPIYNFLYELGDRFRVPRDFRRRLNNTTIVYAHDSHYLALTGCGMDFTWEICDSYLNLGYYPPRHFCRLPSMSGRGESPRDRRIVRGCLATLDAIAAQDSRTVADLRRYLGD